MSAKSGLNRNALSDWIEGSYELPCGTNILNIEKNNNNNATAEPWDSLEKCDIVSCKQVDAIRRPGVSQTSDSWRHRAEKRKVV